MKIASVLPGAILATAMSLACGQMDQTGADAGTRTLAEEAASREQPRVRTFGLDSARAAATLEQAAALPRLRSLVVARHGEILIERRFRGPGLDAPTNVKSVSKSVLSALVGIAIADQYLAAADQPIGPFFERYLHNAVDARKHDITIEQLLTMQSGLQGTSGANYGRWVSSSDWVRHALSQPLLTEPGTRRLYSTGNSHLLSAILTQATGQSTWSYARSRLAEPLGITLPRWPVDPQGIYFGGNEMRLSPRAMVRFGELYRNGGRLDGMQIVPEEWVTASLTPRTRARRSGEGYGYGWFVSQVRGYPMYYAWGYGGQFIFVVPELELTVGVTSDPDVAREREHLIGVRRLLAEWIVPAAEAGDPARQDGLASTLVRHHTRRQLTLLNLHAARSRGAAGPASATPRDIMRSPAAVTYRLATVASSATL